MVVRRPVVGAAGAKRIRDEDEDPAKELAAGPADGAGDLWGDRMRDLNQVLEDDGDETERRGAEQGEDYIRGGDGPGLGGEGEG